MDKLFFVALGGAFGSVARYLTGVTAGRVLGLQYPWAGTFTVNVVGGFLMGFLVSWLAHRGGLDHERWRVLLGVGALGGFTTFSAFSLEAALMIQRRAWGEVGAYVAASVVLSVAALFLGLWAARRLLA